MAGHPTPARAAGSSGSAIRIHCRAARGFMPWITQCGRRCYGAAPQCRRWSFLDVDRPRLYIFEYSNI